MKANSNVTVSNDSIIDHVYTQSDFKGIYTPIYTAYNKEFAQALIENSDIDEVFESFGDTSFWERQTMNMCQFSAAKANALKQTLLHKALYDGKDIRPRDEFLKYAKQITYTFNDTWMNVEYETCVKGTIDGKMFRRYAADKHLYPYWVYRGMMDSRERPEHVALEGKVFQIGGANSDKMFVPNGFNCRCSADQVDESYLQEMNVKVESEDKAAQYLENNVDKGFRFNPGKQGSFPNDSSYFDLLKNVNDLQYKLFTDL